MIPDGTQLKPWVCYEQQKNTSFIFLWRVINVGLSHESCRGGCALLKSIWQRRGKLISVSDIRCFLPKNRPLIAQIQDRILSIHIYLKVLHQNMIMGVVRIVPLNKLTAKLEKIYGKQIYLQRGCHFHICPPINLSNLTSAYIFQLTSKT